MSVNLQNTPLFYNIPEKRFYKSQVPGPDRRADRTRAGTNGKSQLKQMFISLLITYK